MSIEIPDFPRITDYLGFHARTRPLAEALVLDAERQASERLPSLIRVASHATHTSRSAWADASSWADARSGVGLYAARCLARLRRRD
jgi:hypothetical protein